MGYHALSHLRPGEFFFFKKDNVKTLFGQQRCGAAAARPAADDDNVTARGYVFLRPMMAVCLLSNHIKSFLQPASY
jgi:hypothetical protein